MNSIIKSISLHVVKWALNYIEPFINAPINQTGTLLYIACRDGYIEIVKLLLAMDGTEVNKGVSINI